MSRVCIIGGSGFIGSALAREILSTTKNHILVADIKPPDQSLLEAENLDYVHFDCSDYWKLQTTDMSFLKGVETLFFKVGLLGAASISSDTSKAKDYLQINALSVAPILEAAVQLNIKRVILDSSITAVANIHATAPIPDVALPSSPLNFYAMSKAIMEDIARSFKSKIDIHILRYPRVHSKEFRNVISIFNDQVKDGQAIRISGDPDKQLDFVHLRDVLAVNIKAIQGELPTGIIHVSNGTPETLVNIAKKIAEKRNKPNHPIEFTNTEKVPNEPSINSLEPSASLQDCGMNRMVSLDEIISEVASS